MTLSIQVALHDRKDCSELCKMKHEEVGLESINDFFLSEQDTYTLHEQSICA